STRSDGRRREAQALGARRCSSSGDRRVHVDIRDEFLFKLVGKLLTPLRRARQTILFSIPTAYDGRATRFSNPLFQLTECARQLHHRTRAARWVYTAESPRIAMIAK